MRANPDHLRVTDREGRSKSVHGANQAMRERERVEMLGSQGIARWRSRRWFNSHAHVTIVPDGDGFTVKPIPRGPCVAEQSAMRRPDWSLKRPTARTSSISVCETCGESFASTRSDAATCSSACRQKAYRRRAASTAAT